MVKVVLALKCFGLLISGQNPVEAVLADDGDLPLAMVHLVLSQQLHDLCTHSGLGDSNKKLSELHSDVQLHFLFHLNLFI